MNIYNKYQDIVRLHGSKTAIISDSTDINYEKLLNKIDEFAEILLKFLSDSNIKIFGLLAHNEINDIALLFAAAKINFQILTINPTLKRNEIDLLLMETGVNHLIISPQMHQEFCDFSKIGVIGNKLVITRLCKSGDESQENNDLSFLITASSGSTGTPKPIVFSQEIKLLRMEQSKNLYSISENDNILNASAIYHSLGQRLTFLPLLNGAKLILMNNFSSKKWIDTVIEKKVTFTIAVSTHLHGVSEFLTSESVKNTALARLVSSSAAISKDTKRSLYESSSFDFYEQYGASEIATVSNCSKYSYFEDNNSVGKICDGIQVSINSKEFETLNYGEIQVKSPLAFLGYMKKGNLEKFEKNSWFNTSDLGSINNGHLFFFGRQKDVINCGGQNLFPKDIENYLLRNQNIIECAVLGIKDEYFGQIPVAFIVINDKNIFGKREVNSWAVSNIPRFQLPHKYIFLENLPKLGSGKIDYIKLRSKYLEALDVHE
jgi:acyl-CoA synthetase (AMP-forming)/AMP-acid ligase II